MTLILDVRGRRVWDSRGRPTVEAEVTTESGFGRAIAPAGASTGAGEARELRDGGTRLGGLDVQHAVRSVNEAIRAALLGRDVADQAAIDHRLIELDGSADKRRLGANAIVAVSLACAHAAAGARRMPLWQHLAEGRAPRMPLPEVQIFGGGAHAGARVDLQDFLVVAPGARSFAEALEWTAEVYHAAGARMAARGRLAGVADEGGWWPQFDSNEEAIAELAHAIDDAGFKAPAQVAIALDIAATQFFDGQRYALRLDRRTLEREQLADLLAGWIDAYPIVSVEDPFAESDHDGMRAFTARCGGTVQIVGDDYFVTDAERIRRGIARHACNAVLLKPNQIGTLTETRAALDAARAGGFGAIVSARSGESEDVSIVHLAVGWGVPQLKVGSFARSERMAKWNEALRIEEALAGEHASPYPPAGLFARLAGR
jgi:enolase